MLVLVLWLCRVPIESIVEDYRAIGPLTTPMQLERSKYVERGVGPTHFEPDRIEVSQPDRPNWSATTKKLQRR